MVFVSKLELGNENPKESSQLETKLRLGFVKV
jgi:hypothetical protein